MDYNILLFKESDCYKAKKQMKPKGIVVHSTGANNPNLKRYVGPNDGRVGYNENKNHWNQPGVSACVHAFIGKDREGLVCTYQTLPLNICCWGVGSGSKGSYNYNPAYLQFEILEDDLKNKSYFEDVMNEAQELCAKWCKENNISVTSIVSHAEAYKKGYGSNHSDCDHWLSKYGKDMNWFRDKVKSKMNISGDTILVGDKVKIKDDVNTYYNGVSIPGWVKNSTLYARELQEKDGIKVWLVSIYKTIPSYTGKIKIKDLKKL